VPESLHGAVITALNEEAVASAALANKGGINLIHTYEAFGAKMHGALRQEIIFANHLNESGRAQAWLSIPLILTSHTWENGKNEQSHQDPSMAEAMLGELSHISRVLFPPDFNTAAAMMERIYQTRGQFWTVVIPKADAIPNLARGGPPFDERRRSLDTERRLCGGTGGACSSCCRGLSVGRSAASFAKTCRARGGSHDEITPYRSRRYATCESPANFS
jgi:hypothetical protein